MRLMQLFGIIIYIQMILKYLQLKGLSYIKQNYIIWKMIPKKRQIYNFFDDGKCSPSRLYKAYVKKVIPFNRADIHLKIHLINSALNCSWIWNGDTDYFIGCYIPKYDNHLIWFARTKYGSVWIFNLIGKEDY